MRENDGNISPFALLLLSGIFDDYFLISTITVTIFPQSGAGLIGDLIGKLQIDTRLVSNLTVVLKVKFLRFFPENTKHTHCHKNLTKIPDSNNANGDIPFLDVLTDILIF